MIEDLKDLEECSFRRLSRSAMNESSHGVPEEHLRDASSRERLSAKADDHPVAVIHPAPARFIGILGELNPT